MAQKALKTIGPKVILKMNKSIEIPDSQTLFHKVIMLCLKLTMKSIKLDTKFTIVNF